MLSEQTANIIHATAPVLEQHGLAIVQDMYANMFAAEPEVRALFNQANQNPDQQHGALATVVWAFAANVHDPSVLFPTIELINHKHVAYGVRAEHYPIVGKHLLQAIRNVLGEAATDEIVDAWASAFGFLTDLFVAQEKAIRDEQAQQPNGWSGLKPFTISKKVQESDEVTSFYLTPQDGADLPTFTPGQYLPVSIPTASGNTVRCYSLSCRPGLDALRISVKREHEGAASQHLHNHMNTGDTLHIGAPCGNFTYTDTNAPVLLVSGGVGQTPLFSMLDQLAFTETTQPIYYMHAARNSAVHALNNQVQSLANTRDNIHTFVAYDQPTDRDLETKPFDLHGRINQDTLREVCTKHPNLQAYVCGPKPFMKSVLKDLHALNIPESQTHFEFFGPLQTL